MAPQVFFDVHISLLIVYQGLPCGDVVRGGRLVESGRCLDAKQVSWAADRKIGEAVTDNSSTTWLYVRKVSHPRRETTPGSPALDLSSMVRKNVCRLVTRPTLFLLCVRTIASDLVEQQRTPFIASMTILQYCDTIRLVLTDKSSLGQTACLGTRSL